MASLRSISAMVPRSRRVANVEAVPRPGAAGAAHAMDEVLRHLREVVVHDMGDTVDVNAARGDVGCDQDTAIAILKPTQRLVALVLAAVAMDSRGLHAVGTSCCASRSAPCLVRANTRNEPFSQQSL